ncbi:hypothetical protein GCM10009647_046930 [Streptomyces sanglieri]|uniref:Isochorismatase family protein n=1 Tax=Streptomyces sanglieri TaxID=193460 RepID=A0ABW2WKJ3_9ACTN|nr:isochorismatase family protein [Streptomyces sp. Wh19]MDV9198186.1 hypothetical protein [Streptomyces sp. Wh19]
MTPLENRPNTALLVIDVQNDVVEGTHEHDSVVANIGSRVEKARRERILIGAVITVDSGVGMGY